MKTTTANSTFAIGGVSYSADSFVVTENFVLRMNICGKNTAHRKSAKRYRQPLGTLLTSKFLPLNEHFSDN
jgi:hypothetical protein